MNHLEKLLRQYYEWQGYIVRGNVKVGRLSHGGWAGELDIIAYHPKTNHLVHLEPSLDADTWAKREEHYQKKFKNGKKFIPTEVFPWLADDTPIEQIAIFNSSTQKEVAGGKVYSIDEFMEILKEAIREKGVMISSAIPEEHDLLRSIQMAICGYSRKPINTS